MKKNLLLLIILTSFSLLLPAYAANQKHSGKQVAKVMRPHRLSVKKTKIVVEKKPHIRTQNIKVAAHKVTKQPIKTALNKRLHQTFAVKHVAYNNLPKTHKNKAAKNVIQAKNNASKKGAVVKLAQHTKPAQTEIVKTPENVDFTITQAYESDYSLAQADLSKTTPSLPAAKNELII